MLNTTLLCPWGKLTILCLAWLNFSCTTRVVQILAVLMAVERKMKTEEEETQCL